MMAHTPLFHPLTMKQDSGGRRPLSTPMSAADRKTLGLESHLSSKLVTTIFSVPATFGSVQSPLRTISWHRSRWTSSVAHKQDAYEHTLMISADIGIIFYAVQLHQKSCLSRLQSVHYIWSSPQTIIWPVGKHPWPQNIGPWGFKRCLGCIWPKLFQGIPMFVLSTPENPTI